MGIMIFFCTIQIHEIKVNSLLDKMRSISRFHKDKIVRKSSKYTKKQQEEQQADIETIVADIYKFSEFYTKIAYPRKQENNSKLKQTFIDLNNIKVNVSYPFLMSVYDDFNSKIINEKTFLDIL